MTTAKKLRTGFSTGTAASAAAGAALTDLLTGRGIKTVAVDLPGGGALNIKIDRSRSDGRFGQATVIKDGGDDPDVTHRAAISARVWLRDDLAAGEIDLSGGEGVGRVTRPGLPVEPGRPAINPVPQKMIRRAAAKAWQAARPNDPQPGLEVEISVADGRALAQKTLNPRLGIVGGISILGTTGLVKPFSHQAYLATIDSGLDVARANGLTEVVLTTGGKSEKLAMALRPDLSDTAFIQIADFFAHAVRAAAQRKFDPIGLVSFFGKAVKQAQGQPYTHAHKAAMELAPLAQWLTEAGAADDLADRVGRANTARHALDLIRAADRLDLVEVVGRRMLASLRNLTGPGPTVWAKIIDFDGPPLFEGRLEDGAP